MEEMMNDQVQEISDSVESNLDEYMLNFDTGLNMDMQFIQSNTDLEIGSDGLNLFE